MAKIKKIFTPKESDFESTNKEKTNRDIALLNSLKTNLSDKAQHEAIKKLDLGEILHSKCNS